MNLREVGNRVMNFLGLVNAEENEAPQNAGKQSKRQNSKTYGGRMDDDFDSEPRVSYVPRGSGTAQKKKYASSSAGKREDDFEAGNIWKDDEVENERPKYTAKGSALGSASGSSSGSFSDRGGYDANGGYYAGAQRSRTTAQQSAYKANGYGKGESKMSFNENQRTENRGNSQQSQMAIRYVKEISQCKEIIQLLIENKIVLLSMEELDSVKAQNITLVMSGAAFALGAKLSCPSPRSLLLTPCNIEVDNVKSGKNDNIL